MIEASLEAQTTRSSLDDADKLAKGVKALSQEIASMRRQLDKGQLIDLTEIPERMQKLFANVEPTQTKPQEGPLINLLAECESLVRDIEALHGQLGSEIRSDQTRNRAINAYHSPKKD